VQKLTDKSYSKVFERLVQCTQNVDTLNTV